MHLQRFVLIPLSHQGFSNITFTQNTFLRFHNTFAQKSSIQAAFSFYFFSSDVFFLSFCCLPQTSHHPLYSRTWQRTCNDDYQNLFWQSFCHLIIVIKLSKLLTKFYHTFNDDFTPSVSKNLNLIVEFSFFIHLSLSKKLIHQYAGGNVKVWQQHFSVNAHIW